jgi:PPP family 3-phenylpropionic acid transporter
MCSPPLSPFPVRRVAERMSDGALRTPQRQLIPFAALSASYFAHIGFFNPYLSLWLKDMGLAVWLIGLMLSAQSVTRTFAPYVWGWLSDHTGDRVRLMRWSAGVAFLVSLGLGWNGGVAWVVVVLLVMFTHTSSMMPMAEAAMAHLVSAGGQFDAKRYGHVRLWGSVGFLVTVFAAGAWFEHRGMGDFPALSWISLLAVNLSVWALPSARETAQPGDEKPSVLPVLMQAHNLCFFASIFFHVLAHFSIYVFFSLYLDELGYSKFMIGVLWGISVAVEILAFYTQGRWLHHFSLTGWLLVCSLVMVVRMLMTAAGGHSLWLLLVAQLLHAITFAVHHTSCTAWLTRHFPERLRGRGQALYSTIGYGLAGVIGAVGGSTLSGYIGLQGVFWVSVPVAMVGVFFALALRRVAPSDHRLA